MTDIHELLRFQKPIRVKDNGYKVYFCPFCEDLTGHFHLNERKNFWHCFKCSDNGKVDPLKGVMRKGPAFYIDGYDPRTKSQDIAIENLNFEELMDVMSFTRLKSKEKEHGSYILRGATDQVIYDKTRDRGITNGEASRYRLSSSSTSPYWGRSILFWRPLRNSKPRYFIARQICSPPPKYLNPVVRKDFLWTTFYLDEVPKKAVIVEGTFDAISVNRSGYPAMSLLGKSINSKQLDFLLDLRDSGLRDIVVMLDRPGVRKFNRKGKPIPNEMDATMEAYDKLKDFFNVKPVFLQHAHDPDTASKEYLAELIEG